MKLYFLRWFFVCIRTFHPNSLLCLASSVVINVTFGYGDVLVKQQMFRLIT